jgi:hypothetical protein
LKFYLLLTPLPPDTTILAVVKSGLFESDVSSLMNVVFESEEIYVFMTWGEPCANEASSKQEGLNVRKFKV